MTVFAFVETVGDRSIDEGNPHIERRVEDSKRDLGRWSSRKRQAHGTEADRRHGGGTGTEESSTHLR